MTVEDAWRIMLAPLMKRAEELVADIRHATDRGDYREAKALNAELAGITGAARLLYLDSQNPAGVEPAPPGFGVCPQCLGLMTPCTSQYAPDALGMICVPCSRKRFTDGARPWQPNA